MGENGGRERKEENREDSGLHNYVGNFPELKT